MMTDVTGLLLAGGKSRRMGVDKRFLQVGKHTLFDRSLAVLRLIFQEILVVIAQDSPAIQTDVSVIRDLVPNAGSLGGLYTGLRWAKTPYVFMVACDMPFLVPRVVEYMVEARHGADTVMANLKNGLQPMHAVYGQACLPVIEQMVKSGDFAIHHIAACPSLRVRLVTGDELEMIDPDGRSFMNVNTPTDLEVARLVYEGVRNRPPV
jgi:molybdopterin-guanine dinucleotide biosynthesis protein A